MNLKLSDKEIQLMRTSVVLLGRMIPDKKVKSEYFKLWEKLSSGSSRQNIAFIRALINGGKATKVKELKDGSAIWDVEQI